MRYSLAHVDNDGHGGVLDGTARNSLSFRQTESLKAAIELDLFTAIAEGNHTVEEILECCPAAFRGIRILCDYFVVQGLLTKNSTSSHPTRETARFLD